MRLSDGLDDFFGAEGLRDVDDDEVRILSLTHDHGIACFAQPPLEQAKNQFVRFDDENASSHASHGWPFQTTNPSRMCNGGPHFCQMTQSNARTTCRCDT